MIVGEKFGRRYRITIDPKDQQGEIIIELPFSCQFWVERNVMSSMNHMSLDVYNLGPDIRNRIFQDKYTKAYRPIKFEIGYDTLTTVFEGELWESNSARNGPKVITRIEALTGEFDASNTITNKTIESGLSREDVYKYLISDFPNLTCGNIGSFDEILHRPIALSGNTWDLIKKYSDNQCFIDNNEVHVMNGNEVLDDVVLVIDASTGLIESPRRGEGNITLTTLLEPRVRVNSLVELNSTLMPTYNGQYKVIGINHQGMISNSVNGTARSVFNLYTGGIKFREVPSAAQ